MPGSATTYPCSTWWCTLRSLPDLGLRTILPRPACPNRVGEPSGVHDADADVAGVEDRLLEHAPSRVGHRQERGHDDHARQPPVGEHRPDRDVVSPGDEERHVAEEACGVLGGRFVRRTRLVVATPGEALLALTAGLGAALHVPLPDFRLTDRAAGQPRHREATLADEQDAPVRWRATRLYEGRDVRGLVVLLVA